MVTWTPLGVGSSKNEARDTETLNTSPISLTSTTARSELPPRSKKLSVAAMPWVPKVFSKSRTMRISASSMVSCAFASSREERSSVPEAATGDWLAGRALGGEVPERARGGSMK